ncbi:hypothetical protein [Methyloprofundus sp.]|uniref:hypothetical protein n=1 Tax=Methyloprofundus sp. TaxID=2020875 RepID=UPI003D0BBE74
MTEVQDANNRFNTLWEEIGAKRITIGDDEHGLEIVVDADLSVFAIMEKLKEKSEQDHQGGSLSSKDVKAVSNAADSIHDIMEGGMHVGLGSQFKKFFQ